MLSFVPMVVLYVVNAVLHSVGNETDVKTWGILQGSVTCASTNQHDWKQNKCKFKNSAPLIPQQSTLSTQWGLCKKQLILHRKGLCLSLLVNMVAIPFTHLQWVFIYLRLRCTFNQNFVFTFRCLVDTYPNEVFYKKVIYLRILVEEYKVLVQRCR